MSRVTKTLVVLGAAAMVSAPVIANASGSSLAVAQFGAGAGAGAGGGAPDEFLLGGLEIAGLAGLTVAAGVLIAKKGKSN